MQTIYREASLSNDLLISGGTLIPVTDKGSSQKFVLIRMEKFVLYADFEQVILVFRPE